MVNRLPCSLRAVRVCVAVLTATSILAAVPPPSATPAKIIVSGYTSTAIDIPIVKTGQEIPTLIPRQNGQIGNSPGFDWYVSQHYALKTELPEAKARHYLEVLELTYPHWVWIAGGEPTGIENARLGYVYCKSEARYKKETGGAVSSGGITLNHSTICYSWPCCFFESYRVDLLIHEAFHQFMYFHGSTAAGGETITYTATSHVYDSARKQLTVLVFDRAPWQDLSNLKAWQKNKRPIRDFAKDTSGAACGALVHFFLSSDPDRLMKWKLWRDEKGDALTNFDRIFAPTDRLQADWEKWVAQRHKTFAPEGVEQDGNAIHVTAQIGIHYAPRDAVAYDPWRMDYPAEPMPAIVGPVKRGVAEPAVGYLIDFSLSPGCWGGFGLGVETNKTWCQVVLSKEDTLVVDGSSFGIARQEIPLPPKLVEAGKRDKYRFGVTIRIKPVGLEIEVRAGAAGNLQETKRLVALTPEQRERLMSRQMALIGGGGSPKVTPFIDDARKIVDLTKPAGANFWRFGGESDLYRLYRAAWKLQELTPPSLASLKESMVKAMDKDAVTQQAAVSLHAARIRQVLQDVKSVADPEKSKAALAELL